MGEFEVKDIVLLGDGWGALAAYKSLICVFPKLKVVTKDRSLCVCSSLDENDIYSHKNNLLIFSGYKPIKYYHSKGLKILDIGPSTENGIPNYGLCEFKENIGCTASLKYTFIL